MAETPERRIRITRNGPYVVRGGVRLTRRAPAVSPHGEPLEWDLVGANDADYEEEERYSLCRCGYSRDKPYCDATHPATDFDGALTADREPGESRKETSVGDGIIMTDDETLCSDAGFCRTRHTDVWKMMAETGDSEIRERLKRMIANCPSGRLQYSLQEGGDPVELEYEPSIAVVPDGPLWVRGGIELQAADGFVYERQNRVTLCRCGHSKNKPFCDGAHKEVGFSAP